MSFSLSPNVNHAAPTADQAGIPRDTMPTTSNISSSRWQPTNDIDPDQNASIFQSTSDRLAESCTYYSDSDGVSMISNLNPAALSLLHFNVRGITSNHRYTELESFLRTKPLKVVGLCETFLNDSNSNLYSFSGYQVVHKARTDGRQHGGIAILVNESTSFSVRNDLSSHVSRAESLFIELPQSATSLNKKIVIAEIYRPPSGNKTAFIDEIDLLLEALTRENCLCYIMGDFNIDLMVCDSDNMSLNYLNCFHRHAFFPLVNRPTRLVSRTLLDHIFTNSPICLHGDNYSSGIILHDLSDHSPIFHLSDLPLITQEQPNKLIKFQLINERTISALRVKINSIDWRELLGTDDVNTCYTKFSELISQAYFECIPIRTKNLKPRHKPWITASLANSIKTKNRLYATSKKFPSDYSRTQYRSYKNRLNHLLRISERSYASEKLAQCNLDIKRQWKVINTLIERNSHSSLPSAMRTSVNSEPLTDYSLIAKEMNNFFINSGATAIANNPVSSTDPLLFLPDYSNQHSMFSQPVTSEEIISIISSLKDSACGPDRLKPKVIKHIKNELVIPLKHILNISLKKGIFPEKLKEALVTPIFKKGAKDLVNNYRPISVLNVFSKIFEKVMYKRLVSYLDTTNILYNRQFGFRSGHSTEMAVTEVVSLLSLALNDNVPTLAVNMDLSKAFDTIDHSILCAKLGKYGINGNILNWFISYLRGRSQRVQYNSAISLPQFVSRGVPQGSNLGPLLFIIYINDLHRSCNTCDSILYADDCNVFFRLNRNGDYPSDHINATLSDISDWFACNQLALNVGKTNYMVFSGRRRIRVDDISINGIPLEQVAQSNFLGITVDDCLSWKPHIQVTCRKLARSIGIIRKVNRNFSRAIMLRLYNSFILPYINYGITLWGAAYKTSLDPLFVLQKKALKTALHLPIRTNSVVLFNDARVLPLNCLYKLYVASFVFKFNSSLLPSCFSNYYISNNTIHRHNTRSASLLRLPLFSTVRSQQSILFQGAKLWSSIPEAIRSASTVRSFKYKMKRYLFDQLNGVA